MNLNNNLKKISLLTTLILTSTAFTACVTEDCPATGAPPSTIEISEGESINYQIMGANGNKKNISISQTDNTIKIKKLDDTEVLMKYEGTKCESPRHRLKKGEFLTNLERYLVKRERYSPDELLVAVIKNYKTDTGTLEHNLTLSNNKTSEEKNVSLLGYTFDKVVTSQKTFKYGATEYILETKHVQDNNPRPNNGLVYAKVTNKTTNTTEIEITMTQWNGK